VLDRVVDLLAAEPILLSSFSPFHSGIGWDAFAHRQREGDTRTGLIESKFRQNAHHELAHPFMTTVTFIACVPMKANINGGDLRGTHRWFGSGTVTNNLKAA
jgi:hypothetical protein